MVLTYSTKLGNTHGTNYNFGLQEAIEGSVNF